MRARQSRAVRADGRFIRILRCLPAALAASLWVSMLVYFLAYFVSRPPMPDGSWPRISPTYAGFPHISSIGGVRQKHYEAVTCVTAVMIWLAYWTDFLVGRRSGVANGLRIGKLASACVGSVFLVALAFKGKELRQAQYIILTTIQLLSFGKVKVYDFFLCSAMCRRTPENRYLARSRAWKGVLTALAGRKYETPSTKNVTNNRIACTGVALLSIYVCSGRLFKHGSPRPFNDGPLTFSPHCWSLESFSAPLEWILNTIWTLFLCTVAYDNYHLDYTVKLLLAAPEPPKRKGGFFGCLSRRNRRNRRQDAEDDDIEECANSIGDEKSVTITEVAEILPSLDHEKRATQYSDETIESHLDKR